jgi:site-specific DNA-methyltransferase (adenine-specific)
MSTKANFTLRGRNPDVLTCIANLSNDEVFTPPELANQMLDTLAEAWAAKNNGANIWADKTVTFLDPCTKSGVFLREITTRLTKGLEKEIPDLEKRVDHILTKQVFGIAITQMTGLLARRSLYCSKEANGKHSIAKSFSNADGNVWFKRINHTWDGDKCKYCGAPKAILDRGHELENYAYSFIHFEDTKTLLHKTFERDMKFDVIIGNPPYQQDTGGSGRQAKPIYQLFVQNAIKLNPSFISMVVPARWYAGGMGLSEFRSEMLNCGNISQIVDFENAADVFPGVDIAGGICYFLWDESHKGDCTVTNVRSDSRDSLKRKLNDYPIFIRDSKAVLILEKISKTENLRDNLSQIVSSIRPFGIPTNYPPSTAGIPCWFIQKIGLKFAKKEDITDQNNYINKWKLLIPKAPIAGQTDFSKPVRFYHNKNAFIARPGEICTESYIVACAFSTREEVLSFKSYLFTKLVRFLILQTVVSQDVNRMNFSFVPKVSFDQLWTDSYLRDRWKLSKEDWDYVDSRILPTDEIDNNE